MKIIVNSLDQKDRRLFEAVRDCLTPDLLTKELQRVYQHSDLRVKGHCFVATHACFRLFGKDKGFSPYWCYVDGGGTHWWLWNANKSEAVDPTIEQAAQPFPYDKGKKCMVYTKHHQRTEILLVCVESRLKN